MDISATDWEAAQREFERVNRMFEEKEGKMAPAFQQIGSSVPNLPTSLEPRASIPSTLPPASPTTGTANLVPAVGKSTGQQLSVIGAADLATVEQAWQAQDSEALDESLYRSLRPLRTLSLRSISDNDFNLLGYERIGPIEPRTLETLREVVDKINWPAGAEQAAKSIGKCLMLTKNREPDGADLRGTILLFAEDLGEFPSDVIATACRKHARQEKWWPALSELREQCHRANRARRSLKRALS